LIYEQNKKTRGVVKISQATCAQVADWGFYLAPNSPKGTGRNLGTTALTYAFTQLELHKLCGQVIAFNKRSIDFHKALGFAEEGRMQEQHFDGKKFHDVVYFGLLRDMWQSAEED
jgi:RimJ/RimL family protein N-acetyltransferase